MARIRGEETSIAITADGVLQAQITDVKDFEFTCVLEKKKEDFLGQTTSQYDEIFNGIDGKMLVQFGNRQIFDLAQTIMARARRRVPGAKINIKSTLNLPDGTLVRALIPDCMFGSIPFNNPGRAEYLTASLEFSASEGKFV